MSELRVRQRRLPQSRPGRDRLKVAWTGSAAFHAFIFLLIVLTRAAIEPLPQPEDQPSFAVEFEPNTTQTNGGPNPSAARQTPKGENSVAMRETPRAAPPDTQPQMNIIPPEFQQMPPPPTEPDAEPLPPPVPAPRTYRAAPTRHAQSNPFSHPMQLSYAPRDETGPSAGLRNSRSLDLSAGPVIKGGRLLDSVAHVVGPGGRADYLALLSEYIETHKYYPPEAARNGEDGSATVELTVRHDGSVKALRLVASSGSSLLDEAWLAVFRDNRLPPFTDDMPMAQESFMLTLNYTLIYGPPPR